jgi:hypothetical protein
MLKSLFRLGRKNNQTSQTHRGTPDAAPTASTNVSEPGAPVTRIGFWDHLLKQDGDLFANTLMMFNLCGKPPDRSGNIPVVIQFVNGRELRAVLEDGKLLDLPEDLASAKIKQVSLPT